eukprot:scaffold126823_cov16-Tisochrysis_lutea.AAC.2
MLIPALIHEQPESSSSSDALEVLCSVKIAPFSCQIGHEGLGTLKRTQAATFSARARVSGSEILDALTSAASSMQNLDEVNLGPRNVQGLFGGTSLGNGHCTPFQAPAYVPNLLTMYRTSAQPCCLSAFRGMALLERRRMIP